jgi:phage shock protein A
MADEITKRLEKLSKDVKELETKKIRAEQEKDTLKKQYNSLIEELKLKGVEDINNLPDLIAQLEQEFEDTLLNAEKEVAELERKISNI